jgi:hypothetical protein
MADSPSGLRSQVSGFGAKHLEHFRASKQRLPLHPLEKAVLTAVAVHLCFLPWALGTMHPWSQITSLVLSALGLLIALIPRTYSGDYLPALPPQAFSPDAQRRDESRRSFSVGGQSQVSVMRLSAWPRLLRFPIFWIGLALLGYIALQAYNPSWVWERNERTWWLRRVNDIEWLPTSIDSPFERFDIWRQFIIYASAWLTTCTVWIGFTRRRSLQVLLIALVANASLLATAGFLQRIFKPYTILGIIGWHPETTPFASFVYHNHAGAYFALLVGVSAALAIWFFDSGERAMRKSTPAGIFAICAVFLAGTVLFSLSRGATLTVGLFILFFAIWFFVRRRFAPVNATTNPILIAAIIVILAVLAVGALRELDFTAVTGKFDRLLKGQTADESTRLRILAYDSGGAMLNDYWLRGTGAGAFRYLFPEYIKKHADAYAGGRLFWEHAHRDWFEIPIELGAAGCVLLLLGAGWWWSVFYRGRAVWHSLAIPVLLGCGQTLAHAWFDFPFQNPAILCTWLALIAISARWIELDTN